MSDLETAIVEALEGHGGWATALQLRDMLPQGQPRGEAFDLALGRMTQARRLEVRPSERGSAIYRLRGGADSVTPATPVAAPGPAAAVSEAFHPQPVRFRGVPLLGADADEIPPPNPNKVSHAKPKESAMTKTDDSPKPRILALLADGPMRTGVLAKKLDMTEAGASFHLKALEKDRKITKAGRQAPWSLLNGKAAAAAPSSSSARASTKKKGRPAKSARGGGQPAAVGAVVRAITASTSAVEDLEMKLHALDQAVARATKVGGFVLREIREDLQRLGAAVPN